MDKAPPTRDLPLAARFYNLRSFVELVSNSHGKSIHGVDVANKVTEHHSQLSI